MNSLATKLSLAFIIVVVLGVASVSLLVRRETTQSFVSYLEARGGNYLTRVSDSLVQLYQQDGDWRGAQPVLAGLLRGPSDRLVLADAAGRVVADTSGQMVGSTAESLEAVNQAPITVGGRGVGTLYLVSFTPGSGSSAGRGAGAGGPAERGRGPGVVPPGEAMVASLEATYLASVDRAILTAAILSGLVAIAVGLVMARRVTRPLAELSAAARQVAQGHLQHRVKVTSGDELGRVAGMFNAMAESLQRNEEARQHMVADIAHELRTPLTVIEGTVDGILDGVFEPDRDNLASIKEEVALLTKLVADLRTLSLVEAGQLKLDREPTDLLEFVRRSVARVEPLAREKGIVCRVEGVAPGPLVEVDAERMAQVMGNLLSNALRYTPSGGAITVSVGQERSGPKNGRATLSVADTGSGISPESLPHLFDRFYRADQSRSRKSGGSGLGLAIVKQLVEAHGGRVWAESQPGQGSRFLVELPLTPS